ncbi:MAG: hypothetical protein KJI72_00345 [Patescibacteria group bacterium]|nr:hypothetical protein [Patescibacteria group bacterium]
MTNPFEDTGEESKFGFRRGQQVMVVKEGDFFGEIYLVIGFTRDDVLVELTGPPGELPTPWPLNPSTLCSLPRPQQPNLN